MTQRARQIGFLDRFFGLPANEIALHSLRPDLRAWLQPWIDDLEGPTDQPVVLPRRRNGRLQWYAMAFSDRQARSLRDDLLAFVGPSYSDFSGQLAQLDPDDRVERAVLDLTHGRAYRFKVPPPTEMEDARRSLDLMRTTWKRRPARSQAQERPLGRILRDFNMALEAGQEDASAALLEQLTATGRMTASNVAFLKIQRLAALGRWHDLLTQPETETVLSLRRPTAVTEALVQAVYRVELLRFEADSHAAQAVEHFRTSVVPRYSALFKAKSSMRSAEAMKLFMMLAVSSSPPRLDLRQELLKSPTIGVEDREYLALLAGQQAVSPPAREADPLTRASTAIAGGDFDGAYRLLLWLHPEPDVVMMLLHCAYELDSLDATRQAIAAMSALEPTQRTAILEQRAYRSWWEALNRTTAKEPPAGVRLPPADWLEWLERLNTEGPFSGAVEIAAAGAHEWQLVDLADDPKCVADFAAALLADREPESQAVLRNAAPHLVAFLRQADDPVATLRAVYQSAILLIASDNGIGGADLIVLLDLVADLLAMGVSPAEYEEVVGYLHDTWAVTASPRYVDWCLDALDCLAQYPARSDAVRRRFVEGVVGSLVPWLRRLEDYQVELLRLLGEELGVGDLVGPILIALDARGPGGEEGSPLVLAARLAGRKVGIYTLTEAVGRRVRNVLKSNAAGVQVMLNHDKVGSDRLRHLAKDVDILLVAVRSAKHAATDFIDANRPENKPTLICPGKGSASMIRTLVNYLQTAA
jgi:hypothetical protein